jgi:hypothetical protein
MSSAPGLAQPAPSGMCTCWHWPLRRKLRIMWLFLVACIFCTLPLLLIEMQKQEWNHLYQGAISCAGCAQLRQVENN